MTQANYSESTLFVMSGTGNTYRVAHWIKEILSANQINANIEMIDNPGIKPMEENPENRITAVLFPTHGFLPPWSMIKFLFKMPRVKGVRAICVATRGGLKIGPVYIPGAAGFGTFLSAFIMFVKGFHVRAIFSIDMPSNFINFHWGLSSKNIEAITNRSRKKVENNILKILSGDSIYFTRNNLWETLWSVFLFWLTPIFPIFYVVFGRLFMAKLMFSNNKCIGCGICAKFCPNNAIIMKKTGDKKRPFWTFHCETCLRCMGFCKQKAIEAGHSWAILLFFIVSIPVITSLIAWLHGRFGFIHPIQNYWTNQLLNVFYFLPALFVSYRVFWYLIRIPLINRFFTITTLTHYYRRYHQPETKLRDLSGKE